MKKFPLSFVFALFATITFAQVQVPLSLISTSGGIGTATIAGSAQIVEWTIGETFIGDGAAGGQTISIGEQQSTHIGVGISETYFDQAKVYPNPASTEIRIGNMPAGAKTIEMVDMRGALVRSMTTTDSDLGVSTGSLPTGIYTLTLREGDSNQKTYKVSIINK